MKVMAIVMEKRKETEEIFEVKIYRIELYKKKKRRLEGLLVSDGLSGSVWCL